ncbi:hypothetical protein N1851_009352 [Merluccius polli]|uniref:Uncharacterized protein n=1 Tax=Merluccius polli TaxID=89951 RepID=A0AA47N1F5_MERPO|nr:hypothetical protein N1851_009352 [Merluccius polli]
MNTASESAVLVEGNHDNPFGVRLRRTVAVPPRHGEEESTQSIPEPPAQPIDNKGVASPPVSVKPCLTQPISIKPALPKKPEVQARTSDASIGRGASSGSSEPPSWISMARQKQKVYKDTALDDPPNAKKEEPERKSSLPSYVSSAACRESSKAPDSTGKVSSTEAAKTVSPVEKDMRKSLSPPTPVPAQTAKTQTPPCPITPKPYSPFTTAPPKPSSVPTPFKRALCTPTPVPTAQRLMSPPPPPRQSSPASPCSEDAHPTKHCVRSPKTSHPNRRHCHHCHHCRHRAPSPSDFIQTHRSPPSSGSPRSPSGGLAPEPACTGLVSPSPAPGRAPLDGPGQEEGQGLERDASDSAVMAECGLWITITIRTNQNAPSPRSAGH